ncbi:MAG: DNA-directed RNA polymerase subunit D [Thermoplasmata archaeon]|nr:MAG: DNA-directed RNA polymerase subunit D [Thermoplasmata archaeon]
MVFLVKIESIELKERYARFVVSDTSHYFVNALRRAMLREVPKLAIEDVIIYDNTSPLFDEIIAHRLGMIPLPTDLNLLVPRDKCTCKGEGCPNCTVRYTLSKEEPGVIYSGDLQPENEKWKVVDPNIPIVELFEGQRLILEAEAVLGKGKDHAKWQAVIAPGYKYYPIININQDKLDDDSRKRAIEACPKKILEEKDGKLVVKNIEDCSLCKSCVEVTEDGAIEVKGDETRFIFKFETDGSLDAKTVLIEAAKILEEKYKEFEKLIK